MKLSLPLPAALQTVEHRVVSLQVLAPALERLQPSKHAVKHDLTPQVFKGHIGHWWTIHGHKVFVTQSGQFVAHDGSVSITPPYATPQTGTPQTESMLDKAPMTPTDIAALGAQVTAHNIFADAPAPLKPSVPVTPSIAAVSDSIVMEAKGKTKAAAQGALNAISQVHGVENLPRIPLKQNGMTRAHGRYVHERYTGNAVRIDISSRTSHPDFTTCHEVGHFLHQHGIGKSGIFEKFSDPLLKGIGDAIKASDAHADLKTLSGRMHIDINVNGIAFKRSVDHRHLRYLLEEKELFARAYAQYIATRSDNAVLKTQLTSYLSAPSDIYQAQQWEAKDFEPIARAFDDLFRAKGWLK